MYLFKEFKEIYFDSDVTYSESLCPVIFIKSKLDLLELKNLSSDSNKLIFTKLNQEPINPLDLNSNIKKLKIVDSNLRYLDFSLIDKEVFAQTNSISYSSSDSENIILILDDLFVHLKNLKEFELSLGAFEKFIQVSNLEWLKTLNSNPQSNNGFKLVLKDSSNNYDYPDSDFCKFVNFPHEKQVYPVIYTKESLSCSCTLVWLLKYHTNFMDKINDIKTSSVVNCFLSETLTTISWTEGYNSSNSSSFEQLVNDCNFDSRIRDCNYQTTEMDLITETTDLPKKTTRRKQTRTTSNFKLETVSIVKKEKKIDDTVSIVFGSIGIVTVVGFIAFSVFYLRKKSSGLNCFKSKQRYNDQEMINRIYI